MQNNLIYKEGKIKTNAFRLVNFSVLFLAFIFLISFSSAEMQVGLDGSLNEIGINFDRTPVNISTFNVNSSIWWNTVNLGPMNSANSAHFNNIGGTLTIDTAHFDLRWCQLTGCDMSGDINMGGNSIYGLDSLNYSSWTMKEFTGHANLGGVPALGLFVERAGSGENIEHMAFNPGGTGQATAIRRSMMVVDDSVCTGTNATNAQCFADQGGFEWNIDFSTDVTGADLGVTDDFEAIGDAWFRNEDMESRNMNRVLTHLDELQNNEILDQVAIYTENNGTHTIMFLNSTGDEEIEVNFDGSILSLGSNLVNVTLLNGNTISPQQNIVYISNGGTPSLQTASVHPGPNIPTIDVATFFIGTNGAIQSFSPTTQQIEDSINGAQKRAKIIGPQYVVGFDTSVDEDEFNLSIGASLIIYDLIFCENMTMQDDNFFYINNAGEWIYGTDLSVIDEYSDGTPIGGNKYVPLVAGVVPLSASTCQLVFIAPGNPGTEYKTCKEAEEDTKQVRNVFPPDVTLKEKYTPTTWMLMKTLDDTFCQFQSGDYSRKIAGSVTSGGSAPTSPSTDHAALSNLDFSVAGHTGFFYTDGSAPMAGNANIGGNSLVNVNQITDSSNLLFADLSTRVLYDTDGTSVKINLGNSLLVNGASATVVDWDTKVLNAASEVLSLDWENRVLYANDGSDPILNYDTVGLADFRDSNVTTTGPGYFGTSVTSIGPGYFGTSVTSIGPGYFGSSYTAILGDDTNNRVGYMEDAAGDYINFLDQYSGIEVYISNDPRPGIRVFNNNAGTSVDLGTGTSAVSATISNTGTAGAFSHTNGNNVDLATDNYGLYVSGGDVRIDNLNSQLGIYTDGNSVLTTTPPTSGVLGHWTRDSGTGTLSPSNVGDSLFLTEVNRLGGDIDFFKDEVLSGSEDGSKLLIHGEKADPHEIFQDQFGRLQIHAVNDEVVINGDAGVIFELMSIQGTQWATQSAIIAWNVDSNDEVGSYRWTTGAVPMLNMDKDLANFNTLDVILGENLILKSDGAGSASQTKVTFRDVNDVDKGYFGDLGGSDSNIEVSALAGDLVMKSATRNVWATLGDAVGSRQFNVADSGANIVFNVDSDGNTNVTGNLTIGNTILSDSGQFNIQAGTGDSSVVYGQFNDGDLTYNGETPSHTFNAIRSSGGVAWDLIMANIVNSGDDSTTQAGLIGIRGNIASPPEAFYMYLTADPTQGQADAFMKIDTLNRLGLGIGGTSDRADSTLHVRQTADDLGYRLEGFDDLSTSVFKTFWDSSGELHMTSTSAQLNLNDISITTTGNITAEVVSWGGGYITSNATCSYLRYNATGILKESECP